MTDYDSTADTLRHSTRVAELLAPVVGQLAHRAATHDRSKTQEPEKSVFDRVSPRLATLTYGSDEYRASLAEMGPALRHHYVNNPHHPEFHVAGVAGMTLIDLLEMLADWKAAGERHENGSMERSMTINAKRFGVGEQLMSILQATAEELGWVDPEECGMLCTTPDGTCMFCNERKGHDGLHADGRWDGGQLMWDDGGRFR